MEPGRGDTTGLQRLVPASCLVVGKQVRRSLPCEARRERKLLVGHEVMDNVGAAAADTVDNTCR